MTDNTFTGDARNVLQVGTLMGNVYVHDGLPRAVSNYLHDVRSLVPDELTGREQELSELAAFATAPEVDHWYQWWQAPAWAGKTALFGHFVLGPPAKTRVVSFFITARHRGNDDRAAFVGTVVEQLAAMLGQPVPYGDIATSERHLRAMLRTAAEQCAQQNERLLLVVDGLDEDRSDDGYSIAGLLPHTQVADMRVIVSGRPNRPVPDDVGDNHPLKDPRAVRPLAVSPVAKVLRTDVERELQRYLNGTDLQRSLLGFVAAAGGGLTVNDLAHLTEQPVHKVKPYLKSAYGRMFVRQSGLGKTEDLLILAHEELNNATLEQLEPAELTQYRNSVHEWAEEYRSDNWPDSTPHYLLRGYFRLLAAANDVPRMITHATDPHRYNQMRRQSGGDAYALADIRRTMDLVGPDLPALARLAVHRDHLSSRNSDVPIKLPALVAMLESHAHGEELARSIPESSRRVRALGELVRVIADSGDFENAERVARSLSSPAEALEAIADARIAAGQLQQAVTVARTTGPASRVMILGNVLQAGGDVALVDDIEDSARSIKDAGWQSVAMMDVAVAAALAGEVRRAEDVVRGFDHPKQMGTMGEMAAALVKKNDFGTARSVTEKMETLAESGSSRHVAALADVVRKLAVSSRDDVWLAELLTRMEHITETITEPQDKQHALRHSAAALAAGGRADQAERCADGISQQGQGRVRAEMIKHAAEAGHIVAAEKWARTLAHPLRSDLSPLIVAMTRAGRIDRATRLVEEKTPARDHEDLWCEIGLVAARAGDLASAQQMFERVAEVTETRATPSDHDRTLIAVVREIVETGDVIAAERVPALLSDPQSADDAWEIVVKAVARSGDPGRAEGLVQRISTLRRRANALTAVANIVDGPARWRPDTTAISLSLRVRQLIDTVQSGAEWDSREITEAIQVFEFGPQVDISPLVDLLEAIAKFAEQTDLRRWTDQIAALTDQIADPVRRTRALAELAKAVGPAAGRRVADHAETLFQTLDKQERARVVIEMVAALVAVGELARAEEITRTASSAEDCARALAIVAAQSSPEAATNLVVEVVRLSNWAVPLVAPVWHDETVVDAIKEELTVIRTT